MKVVFLGVLVVALCLGKHASAVEPSADELATTRQWAAATFEDTQPAPCPDPGLEVVANHDPVQKNRRFGKPLHIGNVEYSRGLFCHAPSEIIVRLPGPGKAFRAIAGVDVNEHTSRGQGSVIFSVTVAGEEKFRSDVLRGTDPGVPVEVDLDGSREFVLAIENAGDGISCDQADWANARAVLEDGAEVWLDDLPMAGGPVLLEPGKLPFSFTYGGRSSADLLNTWELVRAKNEPDDRRIEHVLTWTDPDTGLSVRCAAVEYQDFPTVEWTLYFKNTGATETPILEDIRALDVGMERGSLGEYLLHHFRGSDCKPSDYGPMTTTLEPGGTTRFRPVGGRPTNGQMPYFNIESTCMDGLIAVVGWPGQWAADFVRDDAKGLRIAAGQELTHFRLLPGEEVRTPLVVLQFWKGDWTRAQNIWRRWMMAHSMPKPGGELPAPQMLGCSSRAYAEMIKADTASQKMFIDRYIEEGIDIDYWWMDAGWYVQEKGWPQVGTWEVDTARFPNGLRPISDYAHERDIKILVWFEPERVAPGTWLTENHPDWIFGGTGGGLLDLGNHDAWAWLVNHVDRLLTEQGIDLYRQDFNMDPLGLWRANDAEDRQGITEIKHVTGYLAFWDELRRRHPGMLIDSCASGGRRNDLETMRRAVPLWRSDYAFEPVGHQSMTYGVSYWLPFHGTGTVACVNAPYYGGGLTPVEPYAFWSNACPSINCGFDMRVKEIDYEALRKLFANWRKVSPCYYGDYYPLTEYSLDQDAWMAWQFDRPDLGTGMVQVFRRSDSIFVSASLPLRGLDAEADYIVTDLENDEARTIGGRELLEDGLPVTMPDKPGAKVFAYEKAKS